MKKMISYCLIFHLMYVFTGCYAYKDIGRSSFANMQHSEKYKMITKNNIRYYLGPDISEEDVLADPETRYSDKWEAGIDELTVIYYTPSFNESKMSLKTDTVKISAESIFIILQNKLDPDKTGCLVAGTVVGGLVAILLIISMDDLFQFNSGWFGGK